MQNEYIFFTLLLANYFLVILLKVVKYFLDDLI